VRTHDQGDRTAEFDIQGADFAVCKPDYGDIAMVLDADHVFHAGTPFD
jgi:hypothetical protein